VKVLCCRCDFDSQTELVIATDIAKRLGLSPSGCVTKCRPVFNIGAACSRGRQPLRGSPRVYELVILSHRESSLVRRIRREE
jgi:hypothetical protein